MHGSDRPEIPEPDSGTRTANLLGICVKAGKLVKGFDSVCAEIDSGRACCILTAADASEKTVKELRFRCGSRDIPVLKTELTKAELCRILHKETAAAAVCDKGFAAAFARILE